MRAGFSFSLLSLVLAVAYFLIAYTSGSEQSREGDIMAGAILYGPLIAASIAALFHKAERNTASLPSTLLFVLFLTTGFMAIVGYNFAGLLVGIINLVLCWRLALMTIQASITVRKDV
jgi:prepilin signal peptidase PulO-like enzyme (type II secretory pathway)